MGLQASVVAAVDAAKLALSDLLVPITIKKRTQTAYVPGSPISYTEVSTDVTAVFTSYTAKEIEADRTLAQDIKLLVFDALSVIPEPNDLVTNSTQSYRVVRFQPIHAGSEIILSVIQVRPAGA